MAGTWGLAADNLLRFGNLVAWVRGGAGLSSPAGQGRAGPVRSLPRDVQRSRLAPMRPLSGHIETFAMTRLQFVRRVDRKRRMKRGACAASSLRVGVCRPTARP